MTGCPQADAPLLSLLEETLRTSEELLSYTRQNYPILSGEDDAGIVRVLGEREPLISGLMSLEYRIGQVLDEAGLPRDRLPPEAQGLRLSIRAALDVVAEMDAAAANTISGRLQEYKAQTMRARNRKHLSAYFRAGL